MLQVTALILVLIAWLTCVFTGLQLLTPPRSRRAGIAWSGALIAGLVLGATHGPGLGFDWLRSESARSDAIALAAGMAALAAVLGTQVDARIRHTVWAAPTATAAALCCSTAGITALAIGRSTRSWDFAAMILGGLLLVAVGALAVGRRGVSANTRVVFGTAALAGVFQVLASTALLVAWNSLT